MKSDEMVRHYREGLSATRRLATLNDAEEKQLVKDESISPQDLDLFRLIYIIARTYRIEKNKA